MKWLLIVMLLLIAGCSSSNSTSEAAVSPDFGGFEEISAMEANGLISSTPGINIIDISLDFRSGHLPLAKNIHPNSIRSNLQMITRDKPCIVYGGREQDSKEGASILASEGVCEKVYRMQGGLSSWSMAGFLVERT
ncbi:MAG: rhodanese-like domain-containing protein, partial [Candidatus Woesearchaeota archaeon]